MDDLVAGRSLRSAAFDGEVDVVFRRRLERPGQSSRDGVPDHMASRHRQGQPVRRVCRRPGTASTRSPNGAPVLQGPRTRRPPPVVSRIALVAACWPVAPRRAFPLKCDAAGPHLEPSGGRLGRTVVGDEGRRTYDRRFRADRVSHVKSEEGGTVVEAHRSGWVVASRSHRSLCRSRLAGVAIASGSLPAPPSPRAIGAGPPARRSPSGPSPASNTVVASLDVRPHSSTGGARIRCRTLVTAKSGTVHRCTSRRTAPPLLYGSGDAFVELTVAPFTCGRNEHHRRTQSNPERCSSRCDRRSRSGFTSRRRQTCDLRGPPTRRPIATTGRAAASVARPGASCPVRRPCDGHGPPDLASAGSHARRRRPRDATPVSAARCPTGCGSSARRPTSDRGGGSRSTRRPTRTWPPAWRAGCACPTAPPTASPARSRRRPAAGSRRCVRSPRAWPNPTRRSRASWISASRAAPARTSVPSHVPFGRMVERARVQVEPLRSRRSRFLRWLGLDVALPRKKLLWLAAAVQPLARLALPKRIRALTPKRSALFRRLPA